MHSGISRFFPGQIRPASSSEVGIILFFYNFQTTLPRIFRLILKEHTPCLWSLLTYNNTKFDCWTYIFYFTIIKSMYRLHKTSYIHVKLKHIIMIMDIFQQPSYENVTVELKKFLHHQLINLVICYELCYELSSVWKWHLLNFSNWTDLQVFVTTSLSSQHSHSHTHFCWLVVLIPSNMMKHQHFPWMHQKKKLKRRD